ncbi:MAG: sigma-54-dependent Fis family transcriptional regulator [Accumulibacter sp.]|uniref:sigma-54 interaction domain-containing protein n=1 Tax=Accumulibacter sp. TaxID=2053492 RepID=UPI0033145757
MKLLPELLSFLDSQPESRIVMDAEYRIIAANRAYLREFAQGRPVRGRHCYEVSHHFTVPCDQAGESCPLRMSQEHGTSHQVLHLHHTPRGEEHVAVETNPIRDEEGTLVYFVETLRVVKHASSQAAAEGLVGRAPAFNRMLGLLMRVAPTVATVMLLGETGTGKELAARLIHEASARAAGPFVAVDCSGLTETLFESEMFGYEKGAFTGATHRKVGLVEAASGGTLFLDEVGDIPLYLQVKLLRLLESGTYRRVGSVETLRADFRLVCATHRDLATMVDQDSFRRDLYYRINVFPVRAPALAERREDIALLASSLLKRVAGYRDWRFSATALAFLARQPYPGNIRELRNLIERASILADGNEIRIEHLADDLATLTLPTHAQACEAEAGDGAGLESFCVDQLIDLETLEARYLAWAAQRFPAGRRQLAQQLGISPRTLFRKLNQDPPETS